jgi:hypothetical protein
MPFKRLLEANIFAFNSAHLRYKFDKVPVVLPWEKSHGDIPELNLQFSDDAIVIRKNLTRNGPRVVSQRNSESLTFGSRFPDLDTNKATESDSDLSDSSDSMTEHSGPMSPKGEGRCGCGNCRETNTRVRGRLKIS